MIYQWFDCFYEAMFFLKIIFPREGQQPCGAPAMQWRSDGVWPDLTFLKKMTGHARKKIIFAT
jgi:hypothetical protein